MKKILVIDRRKSLIVSVLKSVLSRCDTEEDVAIVDEIETEETSEATDEMAQGSAKGYGPYGDIVILNREVPCKGVSDKAECRVLLTRFSDPGEFISTTCAVSYGMSGKDSLTFSSIHEEKCILAVQREIVSLYGNIIERQELPVTRVKGLTLHECLAVYGALLLLEVPDLKFDME